MKLTLAISVRLCNGNVRVIGLERMVLHLTGGIGCLSH